MLDDDLDKDNPEVLDKIKSRMKELFVQLDTLTHYHYTPTPINAEVIFRARSEGGSRRLPRERSCEISKNGK